MIWGEWLSITGESCIIVIETPNASI